MNLKDIYDEEELKLLAEIGILLEDIKYSEEEMQKIEDKIINFLNTECLDGENNLTGIGLEYEQILERLIDFEDGGILEKYNEGDEIELKDGRIGTIVDITNGAHTISINSEHQTGDLKDDIAIVEIKQIYGIIRKRKNELTDDMHEVDLQNEELEEE